jgi:hypothetical protein
MLPRCLSIPECRYAKLIIRSQLSDMHSMAVGYRSMHYDHLSNRLRNPAEGPYRSEPQGYII